MMVLYYLKACTARVWISLGCKSVEFCCLCFRFPVGVDKGAKGTIFVVARVYKSIYYFYMYCYGFWAYSLVQWYKFLDDQMQLCVFES